MPQQLMASVAVLVAVPVGVEWLIAYIKNEQYRLDRAALVLGAVAVVVALLWTLRSMARRLSLVLEFVMIVRRCPVM